MHRPGPRTTALLAASLTVLAAIACSSAPEQPILSHFFTASRLGDTTSLQSFATVALDPRRDGTVTGFDITHVSDEQRTPLNVRTLAQALNAARAEDAAYTKRKAEYYQANEEAITRALRAERDNARLKGKDAEVQAQWAKFREEGTQVSKKVTDAKGKLASEAAVAKLSFADQRAPVDLNKYDGELVTKEITVDAPVKLPSGQTAQKTLVITMKRAVLKAEPEMVGRWVITSVKDASTIAGKSS